MALPVDGPQAGGEATKPLFTLDGVRMAVYRFPAAGDGPAVLFDHATGFCGPVWQAVAAELAATASSLTAFDHRGHGRSGPGRIPVSWWELALDTATVRDAQPLGPTVGVGHSMGGATLVMSVLEDPSRFTGLVLIEPIIISLPARRADHRFAAAARRRRPTFPSRAEAAEALGSKDAFAGWHPDALAGYLDTGLVDRDGGVALACSGEFEAEVYTAAAAHGLFKRLPEVGVPVTLLAGSVADTYPQEWSEMLATSFPKCDLRVIGGADHFLPMTHPEVVARAAVEMMGRV